MKKIFLFLLIYIYNTVCFSNLYLTNSYRKSGVKLNLQNSNISRRVVHTNNYLDTLYRPRVNNNKNLIRAISFDNLLLLNNFIDAIYYNKLIDNKIIIEFKNNTKTIYYYENYNNIIINDIILAYNDIDFINLDDYPHYILDTPFGFMISEKK
jgi:hypothetical protein